MNRHQEDQMLKAMNPVDRLAYLERKLATQVFGWSLFGLAVIAVIAIVAYASGYRGGL